MKLALLNRAALPDGVREELQAGYDHINRVWDVAHDTNGRQRVLCAKFATPIDVTLATATLTRLSTVVPFADNVNGTLVQVGGGIHRLGTPGVYQLTGQVVYASNTTGLRMARLTRNGIEIGLSAVGSGGTCVVQCAETIVSDGTETIELWAYQTSGGNLIVEGPARQTWLRIARVG